MVDIFDVLEKKEEVIKAEGQPTVNAQANSDDWKNKIYVAKDLNVVELKRGNKRFCLTANVDVPDDVKDSLKDAIAKLAEKGFVLRADADDRNTLEKIVFPTYVYKEIFIPFPAFNKLVTPIIKKPTDSAFSYAIWLYLNSFKNKTIEEFNGFSNARQSFLARTMHVYLGEKLNEVIDFAIVYSPCGSTSFSMETDFKKLGWEVSRIIRDSKRLNFKVFNLGNEDSVNQLLDIIEVS